MEEQRRIRRDHIPRSLGTVSHRRRDQQHARASHPHAGDTHIPTLDNLSRTKRELERLRERIQDLEGVSSAGRADTTASENRHPPQGRRDRG